MTSHAGAHSPCGRIRTLTQQFRAVPAMRWAAYGFVIFLLAGTLVACAAKRVALTPAPNAMLAPYANAAESRDSGVVVVVQAEAWSGFPHDLDRKVTPLKVTIHNHSGHPLAIRYKDFVLASGNHDYADIPPFAVRGTTYARNDSTTNTLRYVPAAYFPPQKAAPAAAPAVGPQQRVVITPQFDWDDYYAAPYWYYSYPGMGFWDGSLWGPPDWAYFNNYQPYMRAVHLPTKSMLRKAIPEGVVGNGGSISGFLYFQKVKADKDNQPVTFDAKLVDARTNQEFGRISIPFTETQQ